MSFSTFVGLSHVMGVFVSLSVFMRRAGYSPWHGLGARLLLISPEWFLTSMIKAVLWEVTLIVWLATGRPESRWGVPDDSRSGRITRVVRTPAEID